MHSKVDDAVCYISVYRSHTGLVVITKQHTGGLTERIARTRSHALARSSRFARVTEANSVLYCGGAEQQPLSRCLHRTASDGSVTARSSALTHGGIDGLTQEECIRYGDVMLR